MKLILLAVIALAGLSAFIVRMKLQKSSGQPFQITKSASLWSRLSGLISQRADYLIFVGVPFATPKAWAAAKRQGEDSLSAQGYGTFPVSDVRAFAVAYPNRQIVDWEPCGLPLPKSLEGLSPAARSESDVLYLDDLKSGQAYIQVTYGPSATHSRDRNRYATTLKNISTERIRIHRFAGYHRNKESWRLSTVTSQFYSAAEFREWYGLGSSEWLEPGETATDPNNYGSPPVLWAYYCESSSGKEFIAGEVLK